MIAKALPPLDDDEEAYDGAARADAVEKADADEDASSREGGASWVGTLEKEKRVDVKTSSFETLLEKAMAKGRARRTPPGARERASERADVLARTF